MKRWRRTVHPSWIAPATGTVALALAVLTLLLDKGEVAHASHRALYGLTSVVIAAWAVELAGLRWPRPVFAAAVVVPVAALIALGGISSRRSS